MQAPFWQVHEPGRTRPLSLVDVSNRIMAAACKRRWEGLLGEWISRDQRGFLPGRSMMKNVMDWETASLCTAANCNRGIALTVDFKAAFPFHQPAERAEVHRGDGLSGAGDDGFQSLLPGRALPHLG